MEPTSVDGLDEDRRRCRELTSKWFIETQVPLMTHKGLFPNWFLGFVPRKDAEELLEEKERGCFMIRLSDKTVGYILSFKGRDRCRHFVINQSERGQFIVCGDTRAHNRIVDLLEYYKNNPIEPFGEYLTSSCLQGMKEESYDIIQFSSCHRKPAGAVPTVRLGQNPTLASKQKLTQPSSENTLQVVPPLPRRRYQTTSPPLTCNILYAQLKKNSPRRRPPGLHTSSDNLAGAKQEGANRSRTSDQNITCRYSLISEAEAIYSEPELLSTKSRSLPFLDCNWDDQQSYRVSFPPDKPRYGPKSVRPVPSCVSKSERADLNNRAGTVDLKIKNDVYYLASRDGKQHTASADSRLFTTVQEEESLYTEVDLDRLSRRCIPHNTYEPYPQHNDTGMYQSQEKASGKPNEQTSWELKMSKWKRLFRAKKNK